MSSPKPERTGAPGPRPVNGFEEFPEYLRMLVEAESPSSDPVATDACADVVSDLSKELLDAVPERIVLEGRTHLRWRYGTDTSVMMLGHFDTVWPLGTLRSFPFEVNGPIATGPGVFDMKAGIVQLFLTLRALDNPAGVSVLLTSDEEIGAPTSRKLIEEEARRNQSVLVFEPSFEGALKIARKGAASYRLVARGLASHAGLDPESGINAVLELAHQVISVANLGDREKGTTVTPTVVAGGNSRNTVADEASVYVDVRARTAEEQERVDRALRELSPEVPGAGLEVNRLSCHPPFQPEASELLFDLAASVAVDLGMPQLIGEAVGGASDGNLTAATGTPTLDGLGAVGGRAHAAGEFVLLNEMPNRTVLCAELARKLLARTPRKNPQKTRETTKSDAQC